MIRLAELTYPAARRLARDPRAVVLLPLGAIEQHGPHLPLLVDWLGAEELARRIAPHLRRAGFRPVQAPSIPYGVSTLALGWPGTVSLSAVTLRRVIVEVVTRLAPVWVDFTRALAAGARNFSEIGPGGRGYFGWPRAARARTGRAAMRLRGRLLARALVRALGAPRRP